MVTLRHNSGIVAAVRVLDVSSVSLTTPSRTIVHELIGNATPDFTIRPAGPRTGRLVYVLASKDDGASCEALHRVPGRIFLDDPGVLSLTYIVTGPIRLYLDPRARRSWVVEVDVTEVTA